MTTTVTYTVVDGEVFGENRGGVYYDYVPDPSGSVVAKLNSSQTQTDTYAYWPYGEVSDRTGTSVSPYQFLGTLGYYSDASGLTYVRARYLNSPLVRWNTQDPIGFDGGDSNLYGNVWNNPVNMSDPSGLQPDFCPYSPIPAYHPPRHHGRRQHHGSKRRTPKKLSQKQYGIMEGNRIKKLAQKGGCIQGQMIAQNCADPSDGNCCAACWNLHMTFDYGYACVTCCAATLSTISSGGTDPCANVPANPTGNVCDALPAGCLKKLAGQFNARRSVGNYNACQDACIDLNLPRAYYNCCNYAVQRNTGK